MIERRYEEVRNGQNRISFDFKGKSRRLYPVRRRRRKCYFLSQLFDNADSSEQEVIQELGDPRLIARTIIEAYKASKGPMAVIIQRRQEANTAENIPNITTSQVVIAGRQEDHRIFESRTDQTLDHRYCDRSGCSCDSCIGIKDFRCLFTSCHINHLCCQADHGLF